MLRIALLMFVLQSPQLGHKQNSPDLAQSDPNPQSRQAPTQSNDANTAPRQQCCTSEPPPWWKDPQVYLVIVSFPTLGFLMWQTLKTHHAAEAGRMASEAAQKQVEYMIASERPFVLVEVRDNTELWIRNCGKSAANFVYLTSVFTLSFPEFVNEEQEYVMRKQHPYGAIYESTSATQINVQWLAPGDSRFLARFDPTVLNDLDERRKAELATGLRTVRLYSAIKYRGIASPDVFETRFCYGWHDHSHSLYMDGPPGYNHCT